MIKRYKQFIKESKSKEIDLNDVSDYFVELKDDGFNIEITEGFSENIEDGFSEYLLPEERLRKTYQIRIYEDVNNKKDGTDAFLFGYNSIKDLGQVSTLVKNKFNYINADLVKLKDGKISIENVDYTELIIYLQLDYEFFTQKDFADYYNISYDYEKDGFIYMSTKDSDLIDLERNGKFYTKFKKEWLMDMTGYEFANFVDIKEISEYNI